MVLVKIDSALDDNECPVFAFNEFLEAAKFIELCHKQGYDVFVSGRKDE